ncbi:MAG TPA: formate dehydrogenase accessory sulfurtransferase FdhD [Candidatus Baltobacteraceae bacterium]|nr:formate dehydrogenase accessory sulfurtransferase FdhD [Candidatus Baltobacteraceae bacterium]
MSETPRELPPTLEPGHPLFGLGYAQPVETRSFLRYDGERTEPASATVAEETPVALVYNGRPHVVMMCTPADIDDFALGFTITEEIVALPDDVHAIRVARYSQGIEVEIDIPEVRAEALRGRGRSLVGRTGCGLCGVTTIDDALRPGRSVDAAAAIPHEALFRAGDELPAWQRFNEGTGAVHAAGWATREGHVVLAREDVGRHNALDKLIGAMLRARLDAADGFAVVTSRASYELVQKCAVAGIPLLAAISRPTGLAVRMAEAAGITLAALLRGRSVNVYSHPERLR